MRIAVIGDIHGHLPALEEGLQLLRQSGYDALVCLGDLVDGGRYNDECVELVRDICDATLRGNHDEDHDADLAPANHDWLQSLPESMELNGWLFTHFSPRNRSDKIRDTIAAWNAFDDVEFHRACVGHAHIRALFEYDPAIVGDSRERPFKSGRVGLSIGRRYLYVNPSLAYNRYGQTLGCSLIDDDSILFISVDVQPIDNVMDV